MKQNIIHTTIYIEKEEEITSIIERIKRAPANEIALVVPRGSSASQGLVNLKILKNQSEKIGKKVMLITRDPLCRSLARKIRLETDKKLDPEIMGKTKLDSQPIPIEEKKIEEINNYGQAVNLSEKRRMVNEVLRKKRQIFPRKILKGPVKASIDGAIPSVVDIKRRRVLGPVVLNKEETVLSKEALPQDLSKKNNLSNFLKRNITGIIKIKHKERDLKKERIKFEWNFIKKVPEFLKEKIKELKKKKKSQDKKKEKFKLKPLAYNKERKTKKVLLLPRANVRILLFFLLIVILVALGVGFLIVPKADIFLVLKKETVAVDIEAKVDAKEVNLNLFDQTIPGIKYKKTIEREMKFESNGEIKIIGDQEKAKGNLIVFNEFSRSAEVFIPETRFISKEGLVFKSTTGFRVPGYIQNEGEIIPGKMIVEIIADENGNEYAIADQKLTIPGLKGDPRYEKVYGSIEGSLQRPGENRTKKIPTKDDVTNAKEIMEELIKEEEKIGANEECLEIIPGTVIYGKISWEVKEEIEKEPENFLVKAKQEITALAYKAEDVEKLIDEYLKNQVGERRILGGSEPEISNHQSVKEGELVKMTIFTKRQVVEDINKEKIIETILGLPEEEAVKRMKENNSVENAEIKSWPFWVNKIPRQKEKVRIEIIY